MTNGIRGRIFTWLVVAIVPVLSVALVSTSIVEARLADRVATELEEIRSLEASRIGHELESYRSDADRLSRAAFVTLFTEQVQQARNGELAEGTMIGGQGGFDEIDPRADQPMRQVATAIRDASLGAGTAVVEAQVVGLDGSPLGSSEGYRWKPTSPGILRQVLTSGEASFGNAYRTRAGEPRVGLVTPIFNPQGETMGALLSEVDIQPIVNPLQLHTAFGRTREVNLVQLDGDGNAEFMTQLRFDPNAAFSRTSSGAESPMVHALRSPGGQVLRGTDYRGDESVYAVETIDGTGWGLAVQMGVAEAFAISRSVRTLVLLGSLLAIFALLLGWAMVLRPLVRRVSDTALAAERVANGEYTSRIDDRTQDEIGEVARGIDRLAAEVEFDIRMRNDAERRLRYQATHDELTNIFNRQHMTTLIRESLESGEDQWVSLLFLDLDDFKLVNDLWGHAVGDEVLSAVANRLRRLVGDDVYISRWGGDEFTVALRNADQATISTLAHRVRSLFAQPINTSVGPHPIACSVGVATAFSGDDLDQLLHDADAKMFDEKQANRKSRMIDPETARLVETSLANGRIEVAYQPIVSLSRSGASEVRAVEALVRIRAVDGTLLSPAEFLPAVLSHRYAQDIDRTVTMIALRDLAEWRAEGLVPDTFSLALNLSPASIRDASLVQSIVDMVKKSDIDPAAIILELSEEADDLAEAAARELRTHGFRLAVDDLGLKRSNFDRLLSGVDLAKIDRIWLDNPVVLEALIRTCQENQIEVIGEGVETVEQVNHLFALGVDLVQGYLISKPISGLALVELLNGRPAELPTNEDTGSTPALAGG